ncbi:Homeobox-leucine zipper protein [Musa troglodytarum]|uniref:Homeobox-leucine zipper protein n=1 Tax=Musa troglodytarum TaxID=320322 RepID=A0A9E7FG99_9LILI|nr:Homeobox-leucine zipper protein [Musa troglodytarum]
MVMCFLSSFSSPFISFSFSLLLLFGVHVLFIGPPKTSSLLPLTIIPILPFFSPLFSFSLSECLMGDLGRSPAELDLTIGVPGLNSSSPIRSGGGGCNMRDLDINQPAYGGEEEYPMASIEEEEEEGGNPRPKKLRLSKEQSRLLEESFRQHHTLNPKQKEALAMKLKLRPRQVEVCHESPPPCSLSTRESMSIAWGCRTKLKQTEMECEYLKRCFGSLTEENRRLQREVEELRALRVAPPTVLSPHTRQPLPASSLTMCPRCERVTTAATATPRAVIGRPPSASPFTRSTAC